MASKGISITLPKPFTLDPSDDLLVGDDEDVEVEVAVVPPAFVVVVAVPESAVVVAPPATLTLARVAGGSAVLACVSCLASELAVVLNTPQERLQ